MLRRPGLVLTAVITIAIALGTRTHAQAAPDPWITAKAKVALMTASSVDATHIDVDTDEGRVTLHGTVHTPQQRAEAERITRRISGVRGVRDLLQIVAQRDDQAVKVVDATIKDRVQQALKGDPDLDNSSVGVRSVNRGVVVLYGNAASLSDQLDAIEVAAGVSGVQRVASEIHSPDQLADRDIWYDEHSTPSAGHSAIPDAWMTLHTKLRFMADPDISASDINVDTHHGRVTLFGVVRSKADQDRAAQLASEVSGVIDVKDELSVVPGSERKRAVKDDGRIEREIQRRLEDARMQDVSIHVEVKAGTARLSGSVEHPMDRYAAIRIAHTTDGVRAVVDDLRVNEMSANR